MTLATSLYEVYQMPRQPLSQRRKVTHKTKDFSGATPGQASFIYFLAILSSRPVGEKQWWCLALLGRGGGDL